MLEWQPTAPPLPPGGETASRDGRVLEIRCAIDGTYLLLVWKSANSSAVAGVYSAAEVAKFAAEVVRLDDDSLAALAADPFGFNGTITRPRG
jgi:hypothetical protein